MHRGTIPNTMTAINITSTCIPFLFLAVKKYGVYVYDTERMDVQYHALQTKDALYVLADHENWDESTLYKHPRYASYELFGVLDIHSGYDFLEFMTDDDEDLYEYEYKPYWTGNLSEVLEEWSLTGRRQFKSQVERSLLFEIAYERYSERNLFLRVA